MQSYSKILSDFKRKCFNRLSTVYKLRYCITFYHKLGENYLVDCFEILSDILHNLQSSTSHNNLVTFCHLKTKIPSQIHTLQNYKTIVLIL